MEVATPYDARFDGIDARQRRNRIAAGVALSLLVHAALLTAYRNSLLRPGNQESEPPRAIAVWLRPPPLVIDEPLPQPAATAARAHRKARPLIAVRPKPEPAGEPAVRAPVITPPQQAEPDAAAPHFDADAARNFARKIATARDPVRAATAVGQFPEKPYATESKEARAISSAKRRDCKDGLPGGLLGPLLLLMDKRDSGCKW